VATQFLNKPLDQQRTAIRFYLKAGHEAFAALYHALPAEASTVLMSVPEANKLILKLRDM
jgi:hypothetical protein